MSRDLSRVPADLDTPNVIIRPYRFPAPGGSGAAYTETFDVTGYDLGTASPGGWQETAGTPDEDDTANLGAHMSGQCCHISGAENFQLVFTEGAQTDVYIRFKMTATTAAGGDRFVQLGTAADITAAFYVRFQTSLSSIIRVVSQTNQNGSTSWTGDLYCWVDYTDNTSNGTEIRIGTTGTKASAELVNPTSPSASPDRVTFGGKSGSDFSFDDIEIDFTTTFGDF